MLTTQTEKLTIFKINLNKHLKASNLAIKGLVLTLISMALNYVNKHVLYLM